MGLAAANRLPVIGTHRGATRLGVIVSYDFDATDLFRRGAEHVDRILKGAKPAELRVDQTSRFALEVNVAAANGLGLTLPQSLLLQADEVLQ